MEAAFETSHLEDDNISDGPDSASPVKMDYLRRFQLLNFREVTRLGDVMETVVPIHGTGNFPTLEIRPSEFVELVRRRLASIGIRVHDIRLNGSAATHVLSQDVEPNYKDLDLIFAIDFPPSDFERSSEAESPRTKPRLKSPSSSHGLGAGEEQLRRRKMRPSSLPTTPRQRASKGAHHQEELSTLDDSGYTSSGSSVSSAPESPSSSSSFHQSIRERSLRMRTGSIESASSSASSRRDVTPLLRHQQHVVEQQHKDRCWQMIKDEVMAALLEFMPEGVSRTRMNSVVLGGAYVQKMVKVTNESDRWSLISLNNNTGRNLELKFVQNMRRQFEFSVDSFQIVLDTYLGFKRAANSSSQRPEDHQDRQEEQQDGKDNKTHEEVHQDQKDHQILPRDLKEHQNLPKNHKDHKDHQNHHQDLKDHPPIMNERFHPTVIAESVYGDFAAAIRHLNHRRICTHRPEEIRGGGLLRYCNLLVRDYRPGDCDEQGRDVERPLDPSSSAHPGDVVRTEQHMCSRFFIDFSDIGCQQRKLIGYLDGHFGAEADLKFQYLLQLRKVVSSSTVCLMQHERTLILDLITSLVRQTLAQNVAKHDSTFQPYPYPYQGGVYYQAAPGYYEHGPQYFTSSVVYPLGPPPPHPISERSSPMSSYSSLAPSTHGETCSTSPSPAPLSRPMTPNNPQLCVSYYQEPMMVGDHQGLYPHPHYQPQHHRCCCCGCCCCCGGHLYEQQPFTQPPPTCNGGYGPRVESYRHCPPPITPPIVYSPGTMTCSYHPAAYTAAKLQQA